MGLVLGFWVSLEMLHTRTQARPGAGSGDQAHEPTAVITEKTSFGISDLAREFQITARAIRSTRTRA